MVCSGNTEVRVVADVSLENNKIEDENEKAVPFEEALEITGVGRYNYTMIAISICLLLAMVVQTFGVSMIVTAASCDLQLTVNAAGIIAGLPMLGLVLSSYLWGWLADTRGRRAVLMMSMVGAFVFSIAASFATRPLVLAVCKFLAAFFVSAGNSVTYALFGESTPLSQRNKLVLLLSGGLMCGQATMAILSYPILSTNFSYLMPALNVNYRPWRLLEQVFALLAGFSILLLYFIAKESPKFYASRSREDECLQVLREIYAANTGRKPEDFPVKRVSFEETVIINKDNGIFKSLYEQTAPLFKPPLLSKTVILSYIVIIVYVICPSFMMWMPTIINAFSRSVASGAIDQSFCSLLQSQNNASLVTVIDDSMKTSCIDKMENFTYIILVAFSGALVMLNTMNSFLLRVVNKRTLVIVYHVLTGTCGLFIPWVPNSTLGVVLFFMFELNIVCMGLTTSFTVELYPTYLRAMAVCLTIMIGRGSSVPVISYVGYLIEYHCDATFYIFSVITLSGAAIGFLLPRDEKITTKK